MHENRAFDETIIDLKDVLRILGKWKWVIVSITTIATVTAVALSWFVLPPVYQAEAVIQVIWGGGNQQTVTVREGQTLEDVVGTLSRLPQMTMNTYVNQLKNQVVFQRVINRLQLDQNLYTPAGVARMVTAQAVRDTNLIEIQVINTVPQLAADLANAISEEFMLFISENNQQQLSKSLELLNSQLASTARELDTAVENLREFDAQPRSVEYLLKQIESRLTDLSIFRSQLMTTEISLQQELAGKSRLREQLAATPLKIASRKNTPLEGSGASPDGIAPQEAPLEQANPAYERIAQELAAREVKMSELRAQAEALETAVSELEKEIAGLQAESAGKRAERDRLQGSVDRQKTTYSVLADNITRTRVIRSINIGDASLMVVARGVVPTDPIKPNKRLNVTIAVLLGLMVSTLLAFLLEFLDNTIKTPEDVQRHLAIPVLANVPLMQEPRDGRYRQDRKNSLSFRMNVGNPVNDTKFKNHC